MVWNTSLGFVEHSNTIATTILAEPSSPDADDSPETALVLNGVAIKPVFRGVESNWCTGEDQVCRGAFLVEPGDHAGFHTVNNTPGYCHEHEACPGVEQLFFEAIDARDNEEIARLYVANMDAVLLNEDRGLIQFMDCAKRTIRYQVAADVKGIRPAITRALAKR
jgi:hypothetical protein